MVLLSGGLKLDWYGGVQATQFVQRAISLILTDWQNISTSLPPTPISGSNMDSSGTNAARFYRIEAVR